MRSAGVLVQFAFKQLYSTGIITNEDNVHNNRFLVLPDFPSNSLEDLLQTSGNVRFPLPRTFYLSGVRYGHVSDGGQPLYVPLMR